MASKDSAPPKPAEKEAAGSSVDDPELDAILDSK